MKVRKVIAATTTAIALMLCTSARHANASAPKPPPPPPPPPVHSGTHIPTVSIEVVFRVVLSLAAEL